MKIGNYFTFLVFIPLAAFFISCESFSPMLYDMASYAQEQGIPGSRPLNAYGKVFEQITPEQEYYIGRAVAANVLAVYKLQTNTPAMTAYMNKICNALVINSERPEIYNGYHVGILDSDEINAFATPGGHIFITRGLINCATSEDTLASVIAHEVAHIQLQHGLKAIKSSRRAEVFSTTLSYAAKIGPEDSRFSEVVGSFTDGVNEIVTDMMTKGYSRSQEFDADIEAMHLLSLAGYEPSSIIDMLKVLDKEQPDHPGGFNSTHPAPKLRIENAQRYVNWYKTPPDTRSYREARYREVM